MRHALAVVLVLAFGTSAMAQVRPPLPSALANRQLKDVQDETLLGILQSLDRQQGIIPSSEAVASFDRLQTPVVVLAMDQLRHPEAGLYLFYLPTYKTYFILQAQKNATGQAEARLWSTGPSELVMSAERVGVIRSPSSSTFRLPVLNSGGIRAEISGSDALSCVTQSLGVALDANTLTSMIASLSCTSVNTLSTVLVATNCLSMAGSGGNDVFAPIGCISGVAQLISCGIVNCNNSQPVKAEEQARADMRKRAQQDSRFGAGADSSFGDDPNWDPQWELRWMDFEFRGNTASTARMYHATNKNDPAQRIVGFEDPDNGGTFTGWQAAP